MPHIDKTEFGVEVQALGEKAQPTVITQNEWMRRMKDMSRFQQGMSFYGQMPDNYMLVLNADHPLVKKILADETAATGEALKPVLSEIKGQQARLAALRQAQKDKKAEEILQEEKDNVSKTEKALEEQRDKKRQIVADYAKGNTLIHQLVAPEWNAEGRCTQRVCKALGRSAEVRQPFETDTTFFPIIRTGYINGSC